MIAELDSNVKNDYYVAIDLPRAYPLGITLRMTTTSMTTNPCGRSFASYRRSARGDVARLIAAQRARGIPTWRDLDDMECEPTGNALMRELDSPDTANAVCWLTPDVEDSNAIVRVELPRIIQRSRANDGFFVEFVLAEGLDYADADRIVRGVPKLDSLTAGWNVSKVSRPASGDEIRDIARRVLTRRLRTIAQHDAGPLRLALHTRADAPLTFIRDTPLQIDWCPFFDGRCASAEVWKEELLPALIDIVTSVQGTCPDRRVLASGKCCLPAAFALGRAIIEPSGLRLTWRQHTEGTEQDWSLTRPPDPCGFRVERQHMDFDASDMALLINVRSDVEPAVHASGGLPPFGVVARVSPDGPEYPASIHTPGQATDLARLIANELRRLRTEHPHVARTHIFLSGPIGLAVLVGQQLNGLGPVQTYEHLQGDGPGRYVPAALLTDHLQKGEPT